jgi:hypothetical protein
MGRLPENPESNIGDRPMKTNNMRLCGLGAFTKENSEKHSASLIRETLKSVV